MNAFIKFAALSVTNRLVLHCKSNLVSPLSISSAMASHICLPNKRRQASAFELHSSVERLNQYVKSHIRPKVKLYKFLVQ